MSLLTLPTETLHQIGSYVTSFQTLRSLQTLRALACLSQRLHAIFSPLLYQQDARFPPSRAIAWAAKHGRLDIVKTALSHGAEIPAPFPPQRYHRVKTGHYVYGRKTSLLFHNRGPHHPLCWAVQNGHLDIVEFLIATGCDPNMRNTDHLSLLCLAVIHGHSEIVESLIRLGARQGDLTSMNGNSPIQIAAFQGNKDLVDMLLCYADGDEKVRWTVRHKQEALECAIRGGHKGIIRSLVQTGVDLNYCFQDRVLDVWSPLQWAVEEEDPELVRLFIEGGASLDYFMAKTDSILLRAVRKKNGEMVRVVVGLTPLPQRAQALEQSMKYEDKRIAEILLENGAVPGFEEGGSIALGGSKADGNGEGDSALIPPLICG